MQADALFRENILNWSRLRLKRNVDSKPVEIAIPFVSSSRRVTEMGVVSSNDVSVSVARARRFNEHAKSLENGKINR